MKYFVVSDIHSYFEPLEKSLLMTGYDKENEEHILIVLGDIFDRGPDTLKVYDFLTSIPKERLILLRGNHEDLYLDLLTKSFPANHDFSNGTVRTFLSIANIDEGYFDTIDFDSQLEMWIKNILPAVKKSPITTFIKTKSNWLNYYELGNFIFTHSFIPLHNKTNLSIFEQVYYNSLQLNYFASWRTKATKREWEESRWGCPWMQYKKGYFKQEEDKGKVLVVGHWHTSDFHYKFDGIENNYEIYYSDHLIAIDGCIALTNRQNVLVIEEDSLRDRYGRNLKLKTISKECPTIKEDSWYLPVDFNYAQDITWCYSNCQNRLCLRNRNYHIPKDTYVSVADFTQACEDRK